MHAMLRLLRPFGRGPTLLFLVLGPFLTADLSTAHVNSAAGELRLKPDGPAVGTLQLRSASGADLRGAPGTAAIQVREAADEAGAGELAGSALGVNEARRVDPSTGRPLLGQAPAGSTCLTGSEPGCLPWDHCDPTPAGPLPPCSIAASVDTFEAINGWSIGFSHLDTNTGLLTLWNSTNSALTGQPVDPADVLSDTNVSISELLANAIAGNPGANTVISQGLAGVPVPLVTLNVDPCDGFLAGCSTRAMGGSALLGSSGPTLNSLLTSQQQALLGCGEFYGTNVGSNCEATGVALLNSEASGWFQCLPDGDPNRDYGDPNVPQPCTVGFQSGPVCTRFANGQTLILPGCRGPDDPDYDPAVDGTITDLLHPLTGQQFSSELAALSYNTSMLLVALSTPVDPSQPAEDEFDPTDPQRLDGCSFRKPQLCANVRSLFTFPGTLTTEAEDDPSGPPQRRWVWETGADYEITSAEGSLTDFDGWSFHALGPEVSRVEASDLGVQFILGPPEPCVPPGPVPTSILIRVGIGPDGIPDNGDGCVIGLAYGVVPEPSALLSGGAAGAVLAFLARWRKRRPVRGL